MASESFNQKIITFIKGCRSYHETVSDGVKWASFKVSRKQAWRMFYIAKGEGLAVQVDQSNGIPSGFQIGTYADGSNINADIIKATSTDNLSINAFISYVK